MASYFSETVDAELRGVTVRMASLVFFDFLDHPIRVWPGFGILHAGGHDWVGIGELGSISEIATTSGTDAETVTFTLSGIDEDRIAEALAASEQVKGRAVTIFLQFFDEHWQTLDSPYALYTGDMDQMKIQRSEATRTCQVTAEGPFARRAMPPWGYLSHQAQQRISPGDLGLKDMTAMQNKTTQWPIYI